ncbi:PDR/VanB family oxidoreductase [[Mycobacterium] burgundiense]|uniref:PDR/VanB family oxidoreductase n=1 Tax=[Mycobacterium] burgundiense TaxID=3064286 RepID=A0ABM9LKF0_9MYCO|nr:PDR/VanB family oxidoreductase [Mycolicibacterium sp. MU0053]CAJ1500614.1 PDR/VanB family oxidoreductase [Mycolicibacterium sp. MU0053]
MLVNSEISSLRLTLVEKTQLTDDVAMLGLAAADGSELPNWEPGAHIELHLHSGMRRQYSLCGDLRSRDTYTVCVLRQPDGRGGSAEIHDRLSVGDEIDSSRPRNHFPLVPASEYVLVAGGIGITPIKAMIDQLQARGTLWRLIYGGRSLSSMAFAAELGTSYPEQVTVLPEDEHGLPDLRRIVATMTPDSRLYCCGPAPMLAAVSQECVAAGVSNRLHLERFGAASDAELAAEGDEDSPFTVVLERSGIAVTVPADQSILEAVRAAGTEIVSSCEEGYCGTCETRVLHGQPDHRGYLMTPKEHDQEGTMLICVGRARTTKLVLDL